MGADPQPPALVAARPKRGLTAGLLFAWLVRGATMLVLVELSGPRAVAGALRGCEPAWVAVVGVAEFATFPAYGCAYRSMVRLHDRADLTLRAALTLAVTGFGTFAAGGGFAADRRLLRRNDPRGEVIATAMASFEWLVLSITACGCAVVVLTESSRVPDSILWPWAICVPAGIAAAAWVTRPARLARLSGAAGGWTRRVARILADAAALAPVLRHAPRFRGAWCGIIAYWACETTAFWAAARSVALAVTLPQAVIIYASGYLGTRRALPFGGAGIVEVLFVITLGWCAVPAAQAVAVVIIYRAFNFALESVPALIAVSATRRWWRPAGAHHRSEPTHPEDGA